MLRCCWWLEKNLLYYIDQWNILNAFIETNSVGCCSMSSKDIKNCNLKSVSFANNDAEKFKFNKFTSRLLSTLYNVHLDIITIACQF